MARAKTQEIPQEDKKNPKKQTPQSRTGPKKQPSKKAAADQKKPAPKKEAPKKEPVRKKTEKKTETAAGKAPARKSSPKKKPEKMGPPNLDAPDHPLARAEGNTQNGHRRSIAQKTVDWKTGKTGRRLRWLVLIPIAALMAFFKYCMVGYSFTVLVLGCLGGIFLFYNLCDLLQNSNPRLIRGVRRVFTICLCIGILVVGITECLIIKASFGDPKEQVDYVVVLGAKVRPEGPSVSLMDRIYGARDYLQAHPDAIAVVSGGKGADEPMTEAACMYQELVKLGIDPERIWIEDQATSTWENMHFTLNLIEERTGSRPEKLGVLSSEYHLFRAGLFAKACGTEAVGIPARTSRVSQMVNHFMREVAGVWHYLLLGGQYE